jgi:hypothetical protein
MSLLLASALFALTPINVALSNSVFTTRMVDELVLVLMANIIVS